MADQKGSELSALTTLDGGDKFYIVDVTGPSSKTITKTNLMADIFTSPALTSTPTAPTAAIGTATTQIATTAFVAETSFSTNLPAQASAENGMVLTTDGVSTASWGWGDSIVRDARTSNTVLGLDDRRNLIDITSGTFSQTFAACATLTSGWWCIIRNSGTGEITLEPDGSEQIDGLTNYIMYPGEVRLIQCDGSALRTVVLSSFSHTFTATGTFTTPPGYRRFAGLLWGGGGGGGKSGDAGRTAGGGGGGACNPFSVVSSAFSSTETVTIGDGGTAQTGTGVGGDGGTSSIGTLVYAYGGGGGGGNGSDSFGGGGGGGVLTAGTAGVISTSWAAGGQPRLTPTSNDTLDNPGLGGGSGTNGNAGYSAYGGGGGSSATAAGGKSMFGGGGGGGQTAGTSVYGGAGGVGGTTGDGSAGTAPGGGGGGTQTGSTSGAGARGECRIWGVI